MVGAEHPQAADQHRHLGRGQRQQVGPIDQQVLGRQPVSARVVVAEPVDGRLQGRERVDVRLLLGGVGAPRGERDLDVAAGGLRRLLDADAAREDDQVGQRDLLAAGGVEGLLDPLQSAQHRRQLLGLVDRPAALRLQADPAAVRTAALVAAAERGRSRPRRGDELRDGQARARDLLLQLRHLSVADRLALGGRDRVLPEQLLVRHLGAEVTLDRTHVAVGELEPGARERIGELLRALEEPARDPLVVRVHPQRQVGGQHRRLVGDVRLVRVRHRPLAAAVLRLPLVGAGRALDELPLVAEEDLEERAVPPGRGVGPGTLEAAGDRLVAGAGAVRVAPAEALLLERGGLRLGADVLVGVGGAVRLAEGVAAGDQRDGFLVVHGHPPERLADVDGRRRRVRVGVRALRVDVDQAHLHRGERVLEVTLARVALVSEPGGLGAPVDVVVRLPDVLAAAGEAEGLEAHLLERDVAGQDHQVRPRELAAVLGLDRPEQAAGLVEVGVVGPAVERGEALLSGAGAAAAVADPVGAGAVPGHPDHQRAVVAVVGRPPVLRGRQHLGDVGLDRVEVEGLELRRVVEVVAHRVGLVGVLGEDPEVEAVRPPAGVAAGGLGGVGRALGIERAAAVLLRVHLADYGIGCVVRHRDGPFGGQLELAGALAAEQPGQRPR